MTTIQEANNDKVCWVSIDPCTGNIDFYPKEFARQIEDSYKSQEGKNLLIRKLTPLECERLQGFPDDWTNVSRNGKPAPDGPRYKAIGNSMAVPVMRWIGQRIGQINDL